MTPEQNLRVKSLVDRSDVFNYVIDHLRAQGERSIIFNRDGEVCAYRGIDAALGVKETMCAVGALITDDEYNPTWEGAGLEALMSYPDLPVALRTRLDAHYEMLVDLQLFHDRQISYTDEGVFTEHAEKIVAALRNQWNIK